MKVDVVVVGAGIGGMSAALRLAARGLSVAIVDKASQVGGKMRTVDIDGRPIDSGPTVLTMKPVFDELFRAAGLRFEDFVSVTPLEILARHGWTDGSQLDLYADPERSAVAIEEFAGRKEAKGFRKFLAHTAKIHETVRGPFMEAESASVLSSVMKGGFGSALALLKVDWHRSMWKQLGSYFKDPRLHQLFARYATYYGSDPFQAPGTLSVIAHVEQAGVWTVDGGMLNLALGLRRALELSGVQVILDTRVDRVEVNNGQAKGVVLEGGARIEAEAVVVNADPHAVAEGMLGDPVRAAVKLPNKDPRSLSAITWSMLAKPRGFDLAYHSVFFSNHYADEFQRIFEQGKLPETPTVYICAQDRGTPVRDAEAPERVFMLVNAPPIGDRHDFTAEVQPCLDRTLQHLRRCGLELDPAPDQPVVTTTPNDFNRKFPGTGGALYGPATHGAMAAFSRPNPETRIPNLYMVGGGIHPGAGVPMVALGGKAAASRLLADHPSISRSRPAAMPGGTSMASAATDATR